MCRPSEQWLSFQQLKIWLKQFVKLYVVCVCWQLSLLESLDSGKPLSQTFLKEMPLCIDNFRYFAG